MRAASSGQPLHRLARKLSPKSEVTAAQPGQSLPGTLGTVQSVNGDGTADVVYNGTAIPCQLLGDFVPVVGQGVLVLIEGTRNWCIGPAATAAQTWQSVAATVGYASGWADLGSTFIDGAFRMVGDVVQLRGGLQFTGTVVSLHTQLICTLPTGYAPKAGNHYTTQMSDTSAGFAALIVDTAGGVYFYNVAGADATNPNMQMACEFSVS